MPWKTIIGVIIGAVVGYVVFYRIIGCASGACPITRNPYISSFYGAVLGGLVTSGF